MDLPGQISACKRRIELVRAFIETTTAVGNKSIEAEAQLALEIQLLQMLEAQVADETWGPGLACRNKAP